jgi:hypothetical protein
VTARQGPVEKATRAFVKELGQQISARQELTAQAAYKLARLVDDEPDGSKASALSRELRQLVAALTPQAMPMPAKKSEGAPADAVTGVQDQLARRRREREQGA